MLPRTIFYNTSQCCVEANRAGFSDGLNTATAGEAKARSCLTEAPRQLPNRKRNQRVIARWPEVGIRFCLDSMPEHADRSGSVQLAKTLRQRSKQVEQLPSCANSLTRFSAMLLSDPQLHVRHSVRLNVSWKTASAFKSTPL